jgi:hypothetical protein
LLLCLVSKAQGAQPLPPITKYHSDSLTGIHLIVSQYDLVNRKYDDASQDYEFDSYEQCHKYIPVIFRPLAQRAHDHYPEDSIQLGPDELLTKNRTVIARVWCGLLSADRGIVPDPKYKMFEPRTIDMNNLTY